MSWCIYYDNGHTFSSDDGSWAEAPAEGVLVVVEKVGNRMQVHSGADFYQLDDDSIVMRDECTLLHAIGHVEMGPIKFGRYTSASKMERAMRRAVEEWK